MEQWKLRGIDPLDNWVGGIYRWNAYVPLYRYTDMLKVRGALRDA